MRTSTTRRAFLVFAVFAIEIAVPGSVPEVALVKQTLTLIALAYLAKLHWNPREPNRNFLCPRRCAIALITPQLRWAKPNVRRAATIQESTTPGRCRPRDSIARR